MQFNLSDVTAGLIEDLKALRKGDITNADARVRAQLGREILRSVHLQIEGMKYIEGKAIPALGDQSGKDHDAEQR